MRKVGSRGWAAHCGRCWAAAHRSRAQPWWRRRSVPPRVCSSFCLPAACLLATANTPRPCHAGAAPNDDWTVHVPRLVRRRGRARLHPTGGPPRLPHCLPALRPPARAAPCARLPNDWLPAVLRRAVLMSRKPVSPECEDLISRMLTPDHSAVSRGRWMKGHACRTWAACGSSCMRHTSKDGSANHRRRADYQQPPSLPSAPAPHRSGARLRRSSSTPGSKSELELRL